MGAKLFALLQSGWASTPWLGEEDNCVSKYSDLNPLRAGQGNTGKLETITGLEITPGRVDRPPAGFRYCHYATTANPGLNKDEPFSQSPSPRIRTTAFARYAAAKLSVLLYRSFMDQFSCTALRETPVCRVGLGGPSVVSEGGGHAWAGTWTTSTGGFALHLLFPDDIRIARTGEDAVQLYNKLTNCPGSAVLPGRLCRSERPRQDHGLRHFDPPLRPLAE